MLLFLNRTVTAWIQVETTVGESHASVHFVPIRRHSARHLNDGVALLGYATDSPLVPCEICSGPATSGNFACLLGISCTGVASGGLFLSELAASFERRGDVWILVIRRPVLQGEGTSISVSPVAPRISAVCRKVYAVPTLPVQMLVVLRPAKRASAGPDRLIHLVVAGAQNCAPLFCLGCL